MHREERPVAAVHQQCTHQRACDMRWTNRRANFTAAPEFTAFCINFDSGRGGSKKEVPLRVRRTLQITLITPVFWCLSGQGHLSTLQLITGSYRVHETVMQM